jgi:hypothetical protein
VVSLTLSQRKEIMFDMVEKFKTGRNMIALQDLTASEGDLTFECQFSVIFWETILRP